MRTRDDFINAILNSDIKSRNDLMLVFSDWLKDKGELWLAHAFYWCAKNDKFPSGPWYHSKNKDWAEYNWYCTLPQCLENVRRHNNTRGYDYIMVNFEKCMQRLADELELVYNILEFKLV